MTFRATSLYLYSFLVLGGVAAYVAEANAAPQARAKITAAEGDVWIFMASFPDRGWVKAHVGQPVFAGDSVRTSANSKGRVTFYNKSGEDELDLGAETILDVPAAKKGELVHLQEGLLRWWNGEPEPRKNGFSVRSPTVVAGGSERSADSVHASFFYDKETGNTLVLTRGSISVWDPRTGNTTPMRPGQKLTATRRGLGKVESVSPGEWERNDASFLSRAPGTANKPPFSKPDLSGIWSSSYGDIHFGAGWYGSKEKTLQGALVAEDGRWIYRGRWGRRSSSRSGGVEFIFTSPTSFTGRWWYGSTAAKTTSWTGSK